MKNQDQLVLDEMRKLVKRSCVSNPAQNSDFNSFHKSLLKFFFEAAEVTLDYDQAQINLWMSRKDQQHVDNLHDLNEIVSVAISFTSLEDTLKGCLEVNRKSIRFYQSLLFQYNNVEQNLPPKVSA